MQFRATTTVVSTLLLFLIAMLLPEESLRSQTLFDEPFSAIDPAAYNNVEKCIVAVDRTRDSIEWGSRKDTLLYNPAEPEPSIVVSTAQKCAAKFSISSVEDRDLLVLFRLFLLADRDEEAAQALEEYYSIYYIASSEQEKAEFLGDILNTYMRARPVRLDRAYRVAYKIDQLSNSVLIHKLKARFALLWHARSNFDMSMMHEQVRIWDSMTVNVPDSIGKSLGYIQQSIFATDVFVYSNLKSLGTDSVLQVMKGRLQNILDPATMEAVFNVSGGLHGNAVPLEGDFWFNDDGVTQNTDSVEQSSTLGKLSAIVFMDSRCGVACFPGYSVLQRLSRIFQDALDITLVSHTSGYFRNVLTLSAEIEANWLRKYFKDYLKLPGALSITETPHTFNPPPDLRRVDNTTKNLRSYNISPNALMANPLMVIVDERGIIVAKINLSKESEQLLNRILAILSNRNRVR